MTAALDESMPARTARRILVFRTGQLGDTIAALPAFWAVREHYADARMFLLSDAQVAGGTVAARDVLPSAGLFDGYLSYPASPAGLQWRGVARLLMGLRRHRFDLLAYLAPRTRARRDITRDLAFFRAAGIGRFIASRGFEPLPARNGQPLKEVVQETSHLLQRLALDGVPGAERRFELLLTRDELHHAGEWLTRRVPQAASGQPMVAVGPSSKWPSKRWPLDSFIDVLTRLRREFRAIPIVFGGREDAEIGERVILGCGAGVNAAGELTVRQSAAVLARCALYVGNDTGVMHLAAAMGSRCVAVFSAQDWPGRWHPAGDGHTVLRHSVPCEGCKLRVCDRHLACLTAITPDCAAEACRAILRGGGRDGRSGTALHG